MGKSFSGCEIVEIGIEIERNGRAFYLELANMVEKAEAKKVFTGLAEAETEHIHAFEKIFNGLCSHEPEGVYPEEYYAHLNSLASQHIFTSKQSGEEIAKKVNGCIEGIDLALRMEQESVDFYEEMKKIVPDQDKSIIDKLIGEEKKHILILDKLKEEYKNEEC